MIILIRHAQSEGNKNRDIHQFIPDHRVKLTQHGWTQARLHPLPYSHTPILSYSHTLVLAHSTSMAATVANNPTGRRSRPPAALTAATRRHAAVLHIAVPPHARDDRGHPAHADLGRSHAVPLPPQQDHRLRGAASTRAGLWQLPAMLGRDGAHVAGARRLWPLLLPHPRR